MRILAGLLVFLAFVGGQATNSYAEAVSSALSYWHQKLPTTPIPSALEELVKAPVNGGVNLTLGCYYWCNYALDAPMLADRSLYMFLLEKDLHPGTKMTLHLVSTATRTSFLPRSVADKIPFSSDKLSAATEAVNVSVGSDAALVMKKTLQECESPSIHDVSKYCATSLESMVDYATGRLGTNSIKVMLTDAATDSVKENYTITAVSSQTKLGAKSVFCHIQPYAYAVYYCHEVKGSKVFEVSLTREDRTSAQGIAVCHVDTNNWSPRNVAFKVLNVKPGTAICHFMSEDSIIWLPAN